MSLESGGPFAEAGVIRARLCAGAEDRSGAPGPGVVGSPLVHLGRVGCEVEFAQAGELGEPAGQHECLDAIWVRRGELDRNRAAHRDAEEHRLLGLGTVEDRMDIGGQFGQTEAGGRSIRQASTAPVERQHARHGGEATPEVLERRFLPGQLELADHR